MSECSCIPPHRAWGPATSKDCLYLSGMLRMKTGMEKTSRPPRCGFSYPQPQNGPSRRNLENSAKSQKRLDLHIFFPKNSEARILQGMSRHSESSSLQKFTAVFSFAACPSLPKWYSHCGHGPGVSNPHSSIKQKTGFGHNVRNRNMGGSG